MPRSAKPSDLAARLEARRAAYQDLSGRLAALDDAQLSHLFEPNAQRASFGGRSALLEIDGAKVWAKGIALADIERLPHNRHSTANLFDLPLFYQYGVGSAGFGAWRELAANVMATEWALAGDCASFPLLYHWRVLPAPKRPPPNAEEQARADKYVAGWNGSAAVRDRWKSSWEATANLVLFLEYVPMTVHAWVTARAGEGAEAAEAAFAMLDDELGAVARFMNARGMLHFDLHAFNVLTDGAQLYVADFGLANCAGFELAPAERDFLVGHQDYDRAFVVGGQVWIFNSLKPPSSPALAARIGRYRHLASILGEFLRALREDGKETPYPAKEIEQALAELAHDAASQ